MFRHPIRLGLVAFAVVAVLALTVLPSADAQRSGSDVTAAGNAASLSTGQSLQIEPFLPKAVAAVQAEQAAADQQLQDLTNAVQLQAYADAVTAEQSRQAEAARQAPARQTAAAAAPTVSGGGVWDRLAACETGGNWATNSVPGYSGGLGFANSSWASFGGTAYAPQAWQASREGQIAVAERILASNGWGAWPACSVKLGLR